MANAGLNLATARFYFPDETRAETINNSEIIVKGPYNNSCYNREDEKLFTKNMNNYFQKKLIII